MAGPGDDDRDAVDRAFADLVAGFHLTADRPDPVFPREPVRPLDSPQAADPAWPDAVRPDAVRPNPVRPDGVRSDPARPDTARPEMLRPEAPHSDGGQSTDRPARLDAGAPRDAGAADAAAQHRWADDHPLFRIEPPAAEPDEPVEGYVPPPAPPVQRPSIPALIALIGFAFAVVVVFAASFGLPVPGWAGWGAVAGFVGAFALVIARLPRDRPPGDGAVL